MEQYEPDPQQVWQRVFARSPEPGREDLEPMLQEAMELAGTYRYLTGTFTGKAREQARRLYEGQLEIIACLKGIGILSGRPEEVLKLWQPTKGSGKQLLERCYHRSRRCMAEYMARSAQGEFGVVFRALADREGEHCAIIAGLLGRSKP